MDLSSITLVQNNPVVGDISGNAQRILTAYNAAVANGAALVVFPECALLGYGAEDLLLRSAFRREVMQQAHALAQHTKHTNAALLIGSIWEEHDCVTNVALWVEGGSIRHIRHKHELPNEGVFDERRTFQPGALSEPILWRSKRIGVMICADLWHDRVAAHLGAQSVDMFIVLNASPYEHGKDEKRKALARAVTTTHRAPLIYLNLCGGQDELVFDGGSFVMDETGKLTQQFPYFCEHAQACSPDTTVAQAPEIYSLTYSAMMMGLRDYVYKNGFSDIVLGLSGGIDSALTAIVAVDALGAEHVRAIMLPSAYTAQISLEDAKTFATSLGISYQVAPITDALCAVSNSLAPLEPMTALANENIQSRLRGVLLMAISNATGALLLTTGNKSELATGYATLYGDMCGAYCVLKDVYKTDVFALSHWRNANTPESALSPSNAVIPTRILTRPPSAELRPDQTDQDSLPPYAVLDGILKLAIEERADAQEIIAQGYDAQTVLNVLNLLKCSEYKRSQAPIGVKLTSMAFGKDWRLPLTNGYDFNQK